MRQTANTKWEIYGLLAIFIAVRILFITKWHQVIWDEAVYLGIGKALWSFGNVGLWEIIRPLVLPIILGFGWFINLDYVIWAECVAILFSCGLIYATYLLGESLHSRLIGLLAAFFVAITPTFFLYSGYVLTGIPSAMFLVFSLYYLSKERQFMAGVFAGLAALTRFPHGMLIFIIIGAIILAELIKKNFNLLDLYKEIKPVVEGFLLTMTPFFIFNFIVYHRETSKIWHAIFRPWILAAWHANNPAEAVGDPFFYVKLLTDVNPILWLFVIGAIFIIYKNQSKEYLAPLLVILGYTGFFSIILNQQDRFFLAFLPAIAVFASIGIYCIATFIPAKRKIVLAILSILVLAWCFHILLPVNMGYLGWRFDKPQPITEYLDYYAYYPTNGVVLTMDPKPAVYANVKFIPLYFGANAAEKMLDLYENDAAGIIVSPGHFYCDPLNEACHKQVDSIYKRIKANRSIIYSGEFERNYSIYGPIQN